MSEPKYEIQVIDPLQVDGLTTYRIADTATDSRVATCYLRENAELVCNALNLSDSLSRAARDVLEERQRQQTVECHSLAHDDRHTDGSLAVAAACYALEHPGWSGFTHQWPWEDESWKPKDRRSNQVRAAALVLSEIERLDRAEGESRDE